MDDRRERAGAGPEDWVAIARHQWRWGLGVFGALLLLAFAILFLSRPIYRAEAQLRVGEPPPAPGVTPGGLLGFFRLGGDPFSNDLELLRSRTVASGIVRRAALNAEIHAPRGWHRDSLFTRLSADTTTEKARFSVRWMTDDSVRIEQLSPVDSLIAVAPVGRPISFGGLTLAARERRAGAPREIEVSTQRFGLAVRATRKDLHAQRARRDANVVEVRFDHRDPGVTEAAVQAALQAFIGLRALLQGTEAGTTTDSLRQVALETMEELDAAEAELQAFQRRSGLIAAERQAELLVERHANMRAALDSSVEELGAVERVLTEAEGAAGPAAWTQLTAHPRFLDNATFSDLLRQLLALEQQRLDMVERRTETNRERRLLEERMATLDSALRSLIRNNRDALNNAVASLRRGVAELDVLVASAPAAMVELARRQRRVEILAGVLALTEERVRQEALREALTYANVQVFDPPQLLPKPIWPRKALGLAVATLLGGFFGVLTMIVRYRASRGV